MDEKKRDPMVEMAEYIVENFYNDPVGYCRGVLKYEPDPWQQEAMRCIADHRRVAVRSGHGTGKTRMAASVIHWYMATRPHPQVVATANTLTQLTGKLWRELARVNQDAENGAMFEWTATTFSLASSRSTWRSMAIPWSENNPEAFAGTHEDHVLMVFDESSAIPDIIWETAAGAMTTKNCRWVVLGNPTRNKGKFHECFVKDGWFNFTISCLDTSRVQPEFIQEMEQEYGKDSDAYRVRVLGLPPRQEEQQYISEDIAMAAVLRNISAMDEEMKVLGVDVARFGDDRTILVRRHGRVASIVGEYKNIDTMSVAGAVIDAIRQERKAGGRGYDFICIDVIGIGSGVVDRLKEQGINVIGVNVAEKPRDLLCRNLRSNLWKEVKEWLKTGKIEKGMVYDLTAPHYYFDSSGKMMIERKEDMKKRGINSPDIADALCLTFYPVQHSHVNRKPAKKKQTSTGWMKAIGL